MELQILSCIIAQYIYDAKNHLLEYFCIVREVEKNKGVQTAESAR